MTKYNKQLKKNIVEDKKIDEIIDALEHLLSSEFVFNSNIFADDFRNIINRLKDNSFRLAVVGEFSSGKSTFLNALIGKDILKHGAKETTATITEIQNASEVIDGEVFDVYYESGEIKKDIPIAQLQEYTATSSTLYQVSHEIKKVVIKSNLFDANENVCFIDTPGLNGVADNHREKTIEQIKNAHACIYLMQVRGFGQSDIEFVKFISKYQRNIIFVQNFIDELKELEEETVEGKIFEQKKILEDKIFNDIDNVTFELVGISARKALIARDHSIEIYEGEALNDNVRERLFEESGFVSVLNSITELMNKNEKGTIQKRETVRVAVALLEQLLDILKYQKKQEDEIWINSVEGKKRKNRERIREELEKNRKTYQKNIENYVEAETSDIRRLINKDTEEQINSIHGNLKDELNVIEDIDAFNEYVRCLSQHMYEMVMKLESRNNELMNKGFENLLCNAVLRIKQYTGNEAKSSNIKDKFNPEESHSDSDMFSFKQDEDEILQLENELADKKVHLENDQKRRARIEKDIGKYDNAIKSAEEKIKSIEKQKAAAVSRLGSKPGAERKYYEETYEEYRGGFGILDFFLGPKIRTKRVPYDDYSEQKKWLKKKSDIENEYKCQQDRIQAENRVLMSQIKNYQDDIKNLDKFEPQKQKEIQRIKELLDAKRENIETKRKKAKREYLRNQKTALLENAYSYLNDDVKICIDENFEKAVEVNKKKILTLTKRLFEASFDERIRFLSEELSESDLEKNRKNKIRDIDNVSHIIALLEGYL